MEKKLGGRNYTWDVLKILCTLICVTQHFGTRVGSKLMGVSSATVSYLNPALNGSYIYGKFNGVLGMSMAMTIAFFTFATGYWFMTAFKKNQRGGLHGKGKDTTVLFKYWAKGYSSYWPALLFGTLFTMLFYYIAVPQLHDDIYGFFCNLVTSIPQLFGFQALGIDAATSYAPNLVTMASLTDNFSLSLSNLMIQWDSPLWYMFGIVFYLVVWYAVFMRSETLGVTAFSIVNLWFYYGGMGTLDGRTFWMLGGGTFAIDSIWPRLCGPMVLGVWGWYIIDWLKRQEFSKSGRIATSIVAAVSIFLYGFGVHTARGGMLLLDTSMAVFCVCTMAMKDGFTIGLNKACSYFPFVNHASTIAMGLYVMHWPIFNFVEWAIAQPEYVGLKTFLLSFNVNVVALMFLALVLLLCIPYHFVDKYCLQKLSKLVLKVTKATEPIVLDEPAAAPAAK